MRRGHDSCRPARRHPLKNNPGLKEKSEAALQKLITPKEKAIKDTDQSNPI